MQRELVDAVLQEVDVAIAQARREGFPRMADHLVLCRAAAFESPTTVRLTDSAIKRAQAATIAWRALSGR